MTYEMFARHMKECGFSVLNHEVHLNDVEQVVIRGLEDDFELAACHRSTDGKTLILDVGRPITARGLEDMP